MTWEAEFYIGLSDSFMVYKCVYGEKISDSRGQFKAQNAMIGR